MGYITDPYQFYFEEGSNYLSLNAIKEPIMIDYLELQPVQTTSDYASYLAGIKEQLGSAQYDAAMSITNQFTRRS